MRDKKKIIDYAGKFASSAVKIVNGIIWPNRCAGCGALTDEENARLCDDCWGELNRHIGGDYCPGCGRNVSRFAVYQNKCPQCLREENCFDGIVRAGVYNSVLQHLILAFKNGETSLVKFLAFLSGTAFQTADFRERIDCFVPVPLHWTRRFTRGYNQTRLLASRLCESDKVNTSELVRVRRTKRQSAFTSPWKRRRNVKGAFALRKDHTLTGKTVCLVDDIKTTGATLNECSSVLKQAGVAKVYALVLAVAGQWMG